MSLQDYEVLPEKNRIRLDKLLAEINPTYSRTQVQGWIDQGLVTVNGEVEKANYKCLTNDRIKWTIHKIEVMKIEKENIPLDIVHEDDDILIVNKQRGMVVHPSAGRQHCALVNTVL